MNYSLVSTFHFSPIFKLSFSSAIVSALRLASCTLRWWPPVFPSRGALGSAKVAPSDLFFLDVVARELAFCVLSQPACEVIGEGSVPRIEVFMFV